ncbi:probable G-protein coupled receptor B0563.6 [Penaeus vannamei]|uniref:probable G-protein coupled receptor B0563.6 n=1 Tax=Penaeus vannamei TaxID=6689 RepID=UPI000F665BB0|nr:FMRFamide receptor-like [Penaeus vannamei]
MKYQRATMSFTSPTTATTFCDSASLDDFEVERLDSLYYWVYQVSFPILVFIGVLANVLNLVVLTRPRMRNKTYRWMRALAMADMALCLLTIPVCLSNGGHGATAYSTALYYSLFGWSVSIGAQIFSYYLMVWFAYDRFLAVCRHAEYRDSQRREVFNRRVAGTLAGVAALYLPTVLVGRVCQEASGGWLPIDGYSEQRIHGWYRVYSWVREVISRLVPAVLITVCNIKITLKLRQLRSVRESFISGISPARREKERRLVFLLFWVTALFYVYNTPVTVFYVVFLDQNILDSHRIDHADYWVLVFGALSNLLQMLGNVSNFVLYFLVNPDFHRTLQALLGVRAADDAADADSNRSTVRRTQSLNATQPERGAKDDLSDSGIDQPTDLPAEDARL